MDARRDQRHRPGAQRARRGGAARARRRDGLRERRRHAATPCGTRRARSSRSASPCSTGGHDLARIARERARRRESRACRPTRRRSRAARDAGVPIVERDRDRAAVPAAASATSPITGTNGKTTTTALIAPPARGARLRRRRGGQHRHAAGRGRAARPTRRTGSRSRCRRSSCTTRRASRPAVGVLTNLSAEPPRPVRERRGVLRRQGAALPRTPSAALGVGDATPTIADGRRRWSRGVRRHAPALHHRAQARADALLRSRGATSSSCSASRCIARDELALLGDHNVANALAAALAVMGADESHRTRDARARDRRRAARASARSSIASSRPATYGGVEWINDSKSTNVGVDARRAARHAAADRAAARRAAQGRAVHRARRRAAAHRSKR